jgi:hypothetical protein
MTSPTSTNCGFATITSWSGVKPHGVIAKLGRTGTPA